MPGENYRDMTKDELIERLEELERDNVVFFEPQREIIISDPSEETVNEMSEIAHLETSSGGTTSSRSGRWISGTRISPSKR